MPELPEVETTCRGIEPHVRDARVSAVVVRKHQLRWPIPANLPQLICGLTITQVSRRAKYILLSMANDKAQGTLLIHLGMSGSLRIVNSACEVQKHDHVDIALNNNNILRYTDPRRFGAVLWIGGSPEQSSLLKDLGPEPLTDAFDVMRLFTLSRGKKSAIKNFIMDGSVVVGVGNIYASESLFRAGIDPRRAAGRISKKRYQRLTEVIKVVLAEAIEQGGTTLKDFVGGDGKPGYFKQSLQVYGRTGESCVKCQQQIREVVIGQRNSFYCRICQT
jgi:formamidopyrimidine-DNA glycosylase